MMRNSPRRATLRRLGLAIVALAWIGIAPVTAQDSADEFQILSSDAASGESVAVLVTGWHPVTGEELDVQSMSDGGGMVAITGDEFVEAVSSTGRVSEVRRYEYLPVIAMTMDADALAAAKSYDSGVQVWKDRLAELSLLESGAIVGADRAHKGGYTGKGTWIAVLDTGVDVAHPFIAGRPIVEAASLDAARTTRTGCWATVQRTRFIRMAPTSPESLSGMEGECPASRPRPD